MRTNPEPHRPSLCLYLETKERRNEPKGRPLINLLRGGTTLALPLVLGLTELLSKRSPRQIMFGHAATNRERAGPEGCASVVFKQNSYGSSREELITGSALRRTRLDTWSEVKQASRRHPTHHSSWRSGKRFISAVNDSKHAASPPVARTDLLRVHILRGSGEHFKNITSDYKEKTLLSLNEASSQLYSFMTSLQEPSPVTMRVNKRSDKGSSSLDTQALIYSEERL